MRSAFLEVAADTLGAGAVIVTGVIISATGLRARRPDRASLAVGALIVPRTWRLLEGGPVDILLEASPKGIDLEDIRFATCDELPGVREVHELHV